MVITILKRINCGKLNELLCRIWGVFGDYNCKILIYPLIYFDMFVSPLIKSNENFKSRFQICFIFISQQFLYRNVYTTNQTYSFY